MIYANTPKLDIRRILDILLLSMKQTLFYFSCAGKVCEKAHTRSDNANTPKLDVARILSILFFLMKQAEFFSFLAVLEISILPMD